MKTLSRFQGALLGLACGDALGSSAEFLKRGTFLPLTHMRGGGPFRLRPGEWTDDTSMALCLAESLIDMKGFDALDQMQNYCKWFNQGFMSHNGKCFDIGLATRRALLRFQQTGEPFSGSVAPRSSGNGCIMRLAPVPIFYFPDRDKVIEMSGLSSKTTHGSPECLDTTRLFGAILFQAFSGSSKEDVLCEHGYETDSTTRVRDLSEASYMNKSVDAIRGSGYVVECLEAALWCFWKTNNFKDAVLMAANLGDDADTTAAVCGQIAGAFYGLEGIPDRWLDLLAWEGKIKDLATRLASLI